MLNLFDYFGSKVQLIFIFNPNNQINFTFAPKFIE